MKIGSASYRYIIESVIYWIHPHNINNNVCYCSFITIIPIVERGSPLSAVADFTVYPQSFNSQKRAGLFLRRRMTSNSPQVPSGGKLKLLWKGTVLKRLSDKHAQAYFWFWSIYWPQWVSMRDWTLFESTDQTPSRYCSSAGDGKAVFFSFDFLNLSSTFQHLKFCIIIHSENAGLTSFLLSLKHHMSGSQSNSSTDLVSL